LLRTICLHSLIVQTKRHTRGHDGVHDEQPHVAALRGAGTIARYPAGIFLVQPGGRSGMSVSRLGLGTATFGKQTDEAESHRILDTAADTRINFLDIGDVYLLGAAHAQLGATEEITGCSPI
jgi:hypothetical protein